MTKDPRVVKKPLSSWGESRPALSVGIVRLVQAYALILTRLYSSVQFNW